MRGIALFSLGFLGLLAAQGPAIAAPSQLYGKSVVVSWSEERLQKVNGESSPRSVTRFGQFSVYISSTGKPFSRMSYSFAGRNSARSGNRDSVGGEGRGNRNVSFSGNTMNVVMTMGGGARNVMVNFDGGSCNARVIMGKESGSSSIRAKSIVTGGDIEILSVKTGDASCRVQDGNVFGE